MALAQRQRLRLEQQQAVLVARAHDEERAWVAGELHDDILQRIALVRQELELLGAPTGQQPSIPIPKQIGELNAELVDLAAAVRGIAAHIHPTVVDQIGLPAALESFVGESRRGDAVAIELRCDLGDAPPVSREVGRAAYRIAQEALRNAVRHSGGTTVRIALHPEHDVLVLRVEDNGKGFNPDIVRPRSLGLASLRERATAVGGRVIVDTRLGAGTTIEARLPWTNHT